MTLTLTKILIVAIVYFLVAKLSLLLAIPPGYATAIWPAAGFGLVFVLFFGYRVWPGILIGSIFANFTNSFDPTSLTTIFTSMSLVVIIGFGAVAEAVLGAALIRKFVGYPNELVQEKELMLFLALGGPVSCIVSCTIGVTALYIYDIIQFNQIAMSWGTWWVGDSIGVLVFAPMLLIWFGEPRKEWRKKFRSTFLPLCSMCLLVILFFVHARKWEQDRIDSDFIQQTDQFHQALIKNFEKHLEIVYSLKAFYQSSQHVDRKEFEVFAKELLQRHPGVRGLSWNPVVKPNEIEKFSQMAKKDGITDFEIKELNSNRQLIRSTNNNDHVVIFYLETNEKNESAIGFDISSTSERRVAIENALETGTAAATGKVALVQLGGYKQGFVVFLPFFKRGTVNDTEQKRKENVLGYLAAGFETQNMLKEALRGINLADIRLRIFDESAYEKNNVMYDSNVVKNFLKNDEIVISRNEFFDMGGRPWRIEFSLSTSSMLTRQPWIAWSVLAGGLLFTALLGAFLFVVAGSEARSQELVQIRTAELRESRERFELAVAGSSDGLWDWNLLTDELYISPRYKEMIGYKNDEFENSMTRVQNHIHPQDVEIVMGSAEKHIKEKAAFNVEFRMKMKNGDYKWILTRGQAIWDETGKPIRMVGFHTDISERKEIEKMKGQFFDTISHELRTPLTPIHQFTTILQDGLAGEITTQQKEYLDIILKNTLQLQNIIDDLVDVSRISTGKLSVMRESIKVDDLIGKIIQSFSQTAKVKNVHLQSKLPDHLPGLWADPIRFEQVIRNLIDNAIKYTRSGGSVTVCAEYPWDNSEFVRFMIVDSGQGIAKIDSSKIFDRLYQSGDQINSSRKGLGLGLFICKDIVSQHGGKIWVESELGKGSVFNFTIPAFSFKNLLADTLKKDGLPPKELGIISIELTYLDKLISDEIRRADLKELENYLEHCILPHDVLVPGSISAEKETAYFLIIVANEIGVKIVMERIGKQWVLNNKFGVSKMKINLSYRMVPMNALSQNKNMTTDQHMEMISNSVQRMIDKKHEA